MPRPTTNPHQPRSSEQGYVLISVLFLVALVSIGLAVAATKMTVEIKRDKELELYHRGMQYARAIRLYYRKFNTYPPSIAALEKTSEMRFLRKRYKDPINNSEDWKIIHVGEAKTKVTGMFGQPLSTTAGSSSTSSTSTGSSTSSIFGTSGSSSFGSSSLSSGTSLSSSSTSSGSTSTTGSTSSSSDSTSATTFQGSGGAIMGVASTSQKASIREFRKQKHYNEWEFIYDPAQERATGTGTNTVDATGTNSISATGSSFGSSSSSGFGSSSSSGFGSSSSSGFGSSTSSGFGSTSSSGFGSTTGSSTSGSSANGSSTSGSSSTDPSSTGP